VTEKVAEQVGEEVEIEEVEANEAKEVEEELEDAENKEPADEEEEGEEGEEVEVISFGGEEPETEEEQPAPAWVRDLRKAHKTTQKENRDLRRKLDALEKPKPEAKELREKPTLEQFDYDSDEFESSLEKWFDEKREHEDAKKQAQAAQNQQAEAWQEKINSYEAGKTKLKVKDYAEAEEEVLGMLSKSQQSVIVQYAKNPALVVYALGKNPEKMKPLASEKDLVRLALTIAELEKDLKMVKKSTKTAPSPERRVTGSAAGGATDSSLETLRAEAAKTGDYSKVTAYKRQKKQT
jgi:hypothetical protein